MGLLMKLSKTASYYKNKLNLMNKLKSYQLVHLYLEGKKVLDLGCGRGEYLQNFSKDSLGIEISKPNIKYCHKKGLKVLTQDLNLELPLSSHSFEAIFCSHVLEHLESPIKMLREIKRVLKKGGILVIGLPIEGSLLNYFDQYYEDHPGHLYSFSLKNIKILLEIIELSMERIFFEPPLARFLPMIFIQIYQLFPNWILMKLSGAYWVMAK